MPRKATKKTEPKKAPAKKKTVAKKKVIENVVPDVDFSIGLRHGTTADEIAWVQKRLGIVEDGWFFDKTHEAVVAFQESNDIPVTGQVDERTWVALFTAE